MPLLFGILLTLLTFLVCWLKYQELYWLRRRIPHMKPTFLVGNMGSGRHLAQLLSEVYTKFKGTGPFAGFYLSMVKTVIVLDLELVKHILIKDFNNFDERGTYHNERDDPLTDNLAFTDGEKWRRLRQKLSPTFTLGKMKYMFSTVVKVGRELAAVVTDMATTGQDGQVLEITDLMGRYTADVIGSCAFGLECNSLRDPRAEFVVMGKQYFTQPRHGRFVEGLIHSFPKIARHLRMCLIRRSVHEFYMGIVKETIAYREKNLIKRNDFMDLLIELKDNKSVKDEYGHEMGGLSVEQIAAQAFVFFIAGLETSSTTMTFALYELAQNPEIQSKVRLEINEVMARHKNELSYVCMREMQYLDQIIDETLRMYPILPFLTRKARERYETSNPKYYIERGSMILIPICAIHMDPDFHPEPEKFKPERFAPEELINRPACSWLPFGEGPRTCIGMRFAKMEVSVGLAYLLSAFEFSVVSKTQVPYKLDRKSFLLNPEGGIFLKVRKI